MLRDLTFENVLVSPTPTLNYVGVGRGLKLGSQSLAESEESLLVVVR